MRLSVRLHLATFAGFEMVELPDEQEEAQGLDNNTNVRASTAATILSGEYMTFSRPLLSS